MIPKDKDKKESLHIILCDKCAEEGNKSSAYWFGETTGKIDSSTGEVPKRGYYCERGHRLEKEPGVTTSFPR